MIRQGREKTAFGLTGQGFHSFDETKRFLKFYPSLRVVPKVPTLSFYTKKGNHLLNTPFLAQHRLPLTRLFF